MARMTCNSAWQLFAFSLAQSAPSMAQCALSLAQCALGAAPGAHSVWRATQHAKKVTPRIDYIILTGLQPIQKGHDLANGEWSNYPYTHKVKAHACDSNHIFTFPEYVTNVSMSWAWHKHAPGMAPGPHSV